MLAQEEARRLGHNFVGSEQILLGLIGEGRGIAARRLRGAGVTLQAARIEVEKIIGRGSGFVAVEIPFTPRAKRVLELSWKEAQRLGVNYIGTEHLLLGLLRESEGVAARVLEQLNVNREQLRAQVLGGPARYVSPMPAAAMVLEDTANLTTNEATCWYDEALTIQRAWGIAETVGTKAIEPEHLLLAVLRDDGTIFGALQAAQVKLGDLRRHIYKDLQCDEVCPAKSLPFSDESKKKLAGAWKTAVTHEQMWLTKECLFLALLEPEDGVFAQALKSLSGDGSVIRTFVEEAIKPKPQPEPEATAPLHDSKPVGKASLPRLHMSKKMLAAFGLYALVCMVIVLSAVYMIAPPLFMSLAVAWFFIVAVALAICLMIFLFK